MSEIGKRKGSAMSIEIAQRLYELRREHGFSQESLAAELGLSRQAISKWERSESAPDMGNLIALADLYGITIDDLIRPAEVSDKEPAVAEIAEAEEAEDVETGTLIAETENTDSDEDAEAAGAAIHTAATDPLPKSGWAPPSGAPSQFAPAPAACTDEKQVVAHGHIYTKPAAQARPKCKLRKFPYPLLVVVIFLIMALVFSMWEYVWLFLTIPFYYWIARIIERDPNFLEAHGYGENSEGAQSTASAFTDASSGVTGQ